MSDDLPDLSDRDIVQLMAAQRTIMNHYDELDAEYKRHISDYAEQYGVEIPDREIEPDA